LIGVLPAPCELPLVAGGSVNPSTTVRELSVKVPVDAPKEVGTSTEVLACAGFLGDIERLIALQYHGVVERNFLYELTVATRVS
jgi:hypothetical protein